MLEINRLNDNTYVVKYSMCDLVFISAKAKKSFKLEKFADVKDWDRCLYFDKKYFCLRFCYSETNNDREKLIYLKNAVVHKTMYDSVSMSYVFTILADECAERGFKATKIVNKYTKRI